MVSWSSGGWGTSDTPSGTVLGKGGDDGNSELWDGGGHQMHEKISRTPKMVGGTIKLMQPKQGISQTGGYQ